MLKYSGAVNIKPSSIYFKTAQAHQFSQNFLLDFKWKEKKTFGAVWIWEVDIKKKQLIKKLDK